MHDGSIKVLRDVVDFYDDGGIPNANLDPRIHPLHLTDAEIDDITAFLGALNGEPVKIAPPAMPR
jgi:cytochrome c peroxidase